MSIRVLDESLKRTVEPSAEPVIVAEAKKTLELIELGTTHDAQLNEAITSAREQVEKDTGYALMSQKHTWTIKKFPCVDWIELPIRPVSAIDSVTYYDTDNAQQTLATSVYGFNDQQRYIYLKVDQVWPSITERYDGIVITMSTGFATAAAVPSFLKQAILLQVAKWFMHPDMTEKYDTSHDRSYERIIKRYCGNHFP